MAPCGYSNEDLTVEIKTKVGLSRGDRGPLIPCDVASSEPSDCLKEIRRLITC